MDENISRLIDSDNPQDRKRAIQLLVKEGTQEALTYLSALYRDETDPEIRKMAVEAGKRIRKQQQEAQWVGEGDPSIGEIAKKKNPPPETVPISEMQRTRAESLVELALNRDVAGDNVAARRHMSKALQVNPNLLNDQYTLGIAAEIFGVNAEDVADVIDVGSTGGKSKRKHGDGGDDSPTWSDAFTGLLIYMLIVGAITFATTLLSFQAFSGTFATLQTQIEAELGANWTAEFGEDVEIFMMMTNAISTLGIAFSASSAVSAAIGSVIGMLIWYMAVHFVATTLLSGAGTYPGLIVRTINIYTVFTAISGIVSFVSAIVMVNVLIEPLLALDISTIGPDEIERAFLPNFDTFATIFAALSIASLVGGLVFLYLTSRGIARNYEFGTATGCISQVIAYVVLVVIVLGCFCASSAVLGAGFAAMF